jgi:glycosyltransferase involved in cell wall biosynthesis
MSTIHVLHITRALRGGVGKHVLQICAGTNPKTLSHHIVTCLEDSDGQIVRTIKSNNIAVTNLALTMSPTIQNVRSIFRILLLVRRRSFSIIHGHGPTGGYFSRLVGIISKSTIVYTPHGGTVHSFYTSPPYLNKMLILEKLLYRFTDVYLFESLYSLQSFTKKVKNNSRKYLLNYNAVTNDQQKIYPPNNVFTVGAIGLLRKEKGHDLLIRAVNILVNDRQIDLKCKIFGEGAEYPRLIRLVEGYNLNDNVTIAYANSVADELARFDVLVHPSLFDSLPYTVLEAMHQGVPVIVSKVGGLPELVSDGVNGYTIDLNPTAIADAVEHLFTNRTLCRQFVEQSRLVLKEKFSMDEMLNMLDQVYTRKIP